MRWFPVSSGIVHFVGIGGIGMSGIADILINQGYSVSGSDIKENVMTAKLERKGAKIFLEHSPANVSGASVVVVSSAVSNNNCEVQEARRLKIPVVKRAEMLSELMKMKKSIAIAGTHGKTTTTSLTAALLEQANMDPTVINGGIINAYNSNARLGAGEWIVVEADESDGSFTKLMSTIVVVTNIDFDHVNNFANFDELKSMFIHFIEGIPFYGLAVLCIDHQQVKEIADRIIDRRITTYGLDNSADISCSNMVLTEKGAEFDLIFSDKIADRYGITDRNTWTKIFLPMYGKHNVQNALSVIALGIELGISQDDIRLGLGSFMGVKRRFTQIANINGVKIIDDYAHHPVEIKAVLDAAKTICSGKVISVMQPHRHTRLCNFLCDFAQVLELSDYVYVTPIYSAGEEDNGVDHTSLLEVIWKNGAVSAKFVENEKRLCEFLSTQVASGDYVIFLGAGDITKWAHTTAQLLQHNGNSDD